jgi:hypothetical protein
MQLPDHRQCYRFIDQRKRIQTYTNQPMTTTTLFFKVKEQSNTLHKKIVEHTYLLLALRPQKKQDLKRFHMPVFRSPRSNSRCQMLDANLFKMLNHLNEFPFVSY